MLTHTPKGNGISARDIKTIIEAGYNTVEAIAYTYAFATQIPRRDP